MKSLVSQFCIWQKEKELGLSFQGLALEEYWK